MTLIVGVKCQDGIVIGSDSLETFPTDVEQEVSNKIEHLASSALIASAGAVGLSQLIKARLRESWNDVRDQDNAVNARSVVHEIIWSEVRPALLHAADASEILGEDLMSSAMSSSLIAFPMQDNPLLLRYSPFANSEEITFEAPFVSIGSGAFQADPFLALVKDVVWNNSHPNSIDDGVFGVLWALQHVSEVNAGLGVGGSPVIATLQKIEGNWEANIRQGAHLDQNLQRIEGAKKAVRKYLEELHTIANQGD